MLEPLGRDEDTIRFNEQAIRLSPRDPQLGNWQFDLGGAFGTATARGSAEARHLAAEARHLAAGAPHLAAGAAAGADRGLDMRILRVDWRPAARRHRIIPPRMSG